MDVLAALVTHLLDQGAVTDVVGDRIHKVKRIQGGERPALVVSAVGGPPDDLDLQDEADTVESRIQFSAFADTNTAARAAVDAAVDAVIGSFAVGPFLFWEGVPERPIDLGDDTAEGFVHHVTQDVVIRHSREI